MELNFLYWLWLILGAVLVIAEIFIPSFTILWFGLAAGIVSLLLWISPGMDFSTQLLIWTLCSIGFTLFWFKVLKPRMLDRTKAGISREAVLGQSGQVIQVPVGEQRGQVRFTTPLLGSDEWSFICDTTVAIGDRVLVREVSGNTLIVEKR